MERPHPTMDAGDVVVVEDTGAGRLVSTLNLIPQTWAYAGVPLGVGRVELVGTDPAYQGRGLVRRQLERRAPAQRRARAPAAGHQRHPRLLPPVRLHLRAGGRRRPDRLAHARPRARPGAAEPFRLRLAGEADLAALDEIEQHAPRARGWPASATPPPGGTSWMAAVPRALCTARSSSSRRSARTTRAPRPPGRAASRASPSSATAASRAPRRPVRSPGSGASRSPRASPGTRPPSVSCATSRVPGAQPRAAAGPAYEEVRLALGEDHPAYAAAPGVLARRSLVAPGTSACPTCRRSSTASDRPGGAPGRLAVAGYTGRLSLSFYRDGLRLRPERGHLGGERGRGRRSGPPTRVSPI